MESRNKIKVKNISRLNYSHSSHFPEGEICCLVIIEQFAINYMSAETAQSGNKIYRFSNENFEKSDICDPFGWKVIKSDNEWLWVEKVTKWSPWMLRHQMKKFPDFDENSPTFPSLIKFRDFSRFSLTFPEVATLFQYKLNDWNPQYKVNRTLILICVTYLYQLKFTKNN